MARKLGIDPGLILGEQDPKMNAARLAAAHIYQNADEEQAREQRAQAANSRR